MVISNTIKQQLEQFFISGEKELKLDYTLPLIDFEELIKSLGFKEDRDNFDTNGWEIDFWYYFEHPSYGNFCLSGSFWYGNFTITKEEN